MFEDEESKIRRNLLAVSAAILLFAWLNVPTGTVAKRIFGDTENWVLSPARFWPPVLALLFYLAARFQYCDEFSKAIARFREELFNAQHDVRTRFFHLTLERFARTGTDSSVFANCLSAMFNAVVSERLGTRNAGWQPGWRVRKVIVQTTQWRHGQAHWNFFHEDEKDGGLVGSDCLLGYVLTWPQEMRNHLLGYYRVLIISRSSIDVLWPCAVCLVATAVVAWNVGTALFPRVAAMLL